MKNLLLTGLAVAALSLPASAQQRMTLHEEFTGENCPPCASTNPTFWALCDLAANANKIIHISYMSPIPSSGWFYMQTQSMSDTRISYYSVPFAPYGRYDGHVPNATASSPGHPGYFTQADIDAEYAVASPFNMSVTNAWNATYDSIVTTVTVNCVANWSGTGVYLRAALVQTCNFSSPPGTNGESDFENVVRAMYPSALGTSIANTWTTGMTQTFTITGAVPSFVEKDKAPYMVVWIQNDADKVIAQAAKGTPLPGVPNDAAITTVNAPGFVCVANGPYTAAHSVVLKNAGSNPITSATIYYQVDGAGAFLSTPWSGTLAPGASTTVTMPATTPTVTGAFYHSFFDSVANVNGGLDQNGGNNTMSAAYFTESTNGLAMPYNTSFESADLGKFWYTDNNNNQKTWGAWTNTAGLGHSSAIAEKFDCYNFASGESEVLTLPEVVTSSPSTIEFWVAYAQYDATSNDQLEVVYSTNCGSSWTSLWSAAGTALTPALTTTSGFTPTSAQYVHKAQDISAVPAGSVIGFRATSNYGNNIWIDDVTLRAGGVGVNNVTEQASEVSVFPNPATSETNLTFNLTAATNVSVEVYDAVGRVVFSVPAQQMNTGAHSINIPVANMANGVYNVVMTTEAGKTTQRFTVAK